jgi:hypothetical protein
MDEKVITPLDEIDKEIRFDPEPESVGTRDDHEHFDWAFECTNCEAVSEQEQEYERWAYHNEPTFMADLLFDPTPTIVRCNL